LKGVATSLGTIPSKYASAVNQELYKNRAVTGNYTMPPLYISIDMECAGYVMANKYVCTIHWAHQGFYDNVLYKQT